MLQKDVPQDQNYTLGGGRKAMYALGADGRYRVVPSTGWQVEETVTDQAIQNYRRLCREALERAQRGLASTLEVHMLNHRLSPETLADATGFFRWRVNRHLKPKNFARLAPKIVERYARAIGIPVSELLSLPAEAP